jgi:chloramphenicol O-acetyltransferase type A
MEYLEIETWNRKQHFEHFKQLVDPYFGVTVEVDVTKAYQTAKEKNISFFVLYLHACMKAINSIENFKYRITEDERIRIHDVIHASATIMRPDNTFGFSFIHYSSSLDEFHENFKKEKERILNSTELFPPINSDNCIYCSALPWLNFTGHKEPKGSESDSITRLAFGNFIEKENRLKMPVSISVNHALIDGYHVSLFFENYQKALDTIQ